LEECSILIFEGLYYIQNYGVDTSLNSSDVNLINRAE